MADSLIFLYINVVRVLISYVLSSGAFWGRIQKEILPIVAYVLCRALPNTGVLTPRSAIIILFPNVLLLR